MGPFLLGPDERENEGLLNPLFRYKIRTCEKLLEGTQYPFFEYNP
jgi:hypothetical protein